MYTNSLEEMSVTGGDGTCSALAEVSQDRINVRC